MDTPVNILIVDDEPKNLTVLETVLADPGYRLVRADSAEQALLALVSEEFALLILDVRMPGMTGFELAKMVKERKKTARVPIIFLTAYFNEDQHVLTGYDSGAVDYLHKPVNPNILRSKVGVFVELHRKSRELETANRALLAEVAERRRAEEQLRELNESLEERVAERTEALRQYDRRKDEFLATLAHELRNPLAPVRNALQILQMKGPVTPEVTWAGAVIDRQLRQMTRLIDDLMDVNRIRQGRIELRREPVELAQVVAAAVETSRPHIDEHGHELTVVLPPDAVVVDGDHVRLTQVFMNLLTNAAKYSERGGVIRLYAERQDGDVVVSVKDNGIGIPGTKLRAIFEMFSQVDSALARAQGGLGIGLNLAKQLVEMHGGSIEARSDGPGKGSEFVVRLPIVMGRPCPRTSDAAHPAHPASRLRILVVDDNRDAAATAALLLQVLGHEVRVAYDGQEAVAAAGDYMPDVILCDIGLPRMNGYDAARAIRREPWGKGMTLIALTGWGQDEDRQRAKEAGFDAHVVKPVDPQALAKMLATLPVSARGQSAATA